MGEVVSSEGTVSVPGLMPALLPRNYFSYKLFSRSDAVWGLKQCFLLLAMYFQALTQLHSLVY